MKCHYWYFGTQVIDTIQEGDLEYKVDKQVVLISKEGLGIFTSSNFSIGERKYLETQCNISQFLCIWYMNIFV